MPNGFLEHANITVSDPDRLSALLQNLCNWHERWSGPAQLGGRTIHVGTEQQYLALYARADGTAGPFAKGAPLNHVALVVDDIEAAEALVVAAGLEPFAHGDYDPGRRFYFFDWDGIEFEIVDYG